MELVSLEDITWISAVKRDSLVHTTAGTVPVRRRISEWESLLPESVSHDTSRIARAKLMAQVGKEFPLECPACGGDIRLIAFRLLSECETIPGLRTLGNLRLLRTSCPRTRGRRTQRGSAPTREKRNSRGGRQADRERLAADWETGARDSRAAHQAGNACGSAIGRAILFK